MKRIARMKILTSMDQMKDEPSVIPSDEFAFPCLINAKDC